MDEPVRTAELPSLQEDSTERAYRYLENQIVELQIAPGERIAEAEVARSLHMSRGPVREALRMLESVGLVVRLPNRGVRVAAYDENELEELDTLRIHLLSLAGRLAAERASHAQIQRMREIVEKMAPVVNSDDHRSYAEHNLSFHQLLNEMARNSKLSHHISIIYRQIRRYHLLAISFPEAMLDSYESHRRILAAIEARDPDAVDAEMRHHGQLSYRVLKANFHRLSRAFRSNTRDREPKRQVPFVSRIHNSEERL